MSEQEEKKTPKKRKRKFARRKRWLRIIFGTVAAILLSLAVAYMTKDKSITIDSDDINTAVTQSSSAYEDSVVWNKESGRLIAKIFIGNKDNIDDVNDDSNLSNLTYTVSLATLIDGSMKGQRVKGTVHRVNNHYVVFAFDGVKEGFGLVRIDMEAKEIHPSVNTEFNPSEQFYIKETKVKTSNNIREETTEVYKNSWQKYKINWYKKEIAKFSKKIKEYQSQISGNNDVAKKLQAEKAKKAKISSTGADEIQSQIDQLKQTNSQLQTSIADTQKEIQGYQAKIDLTEKGNF